jgi:hypothetical protein
VNKKTLQEDEVDFEKLLQSMKREAGGEAGHESGVLGERTASGAPTSPPRVAGAPFSARARDRAVDPGLR